MDPTLVFSVLLLIAAAIFGFACMRFAVNLHRAPQVDKRMQKHLSELRRMIFAAAILSGLCAMFVEAMILFYYSEKGPNSGQTTIVAGEKIFDACKTILPPLMALVIGYFFGRSASSDDSKAEEDQTGDMGHTEGNKRSG
jgi:hypothetical protein